MNRFKAYPVNTPGMHVLTATCPNGEQMIGGGFRSSAAAIDNGNVGGTSLVILSNYPSDTNTWTVEVGAQPSISPDAIVVVDCYCYTGSNKLGMAINSTPPHAAIIGSSGGELDFIEPCSAPDNAVVTAGGWRVTQPTDLETGNWIDTARLYNGGVWGSFPKVNDAGIPIGWSTDYRWPAPGVVPSVSTYVLYATGANKKSPLSKGQPTAKIQTLKPGPAKNKTLDTTSLPIGLRFIRVDCDPGYFASGGGFQMGVLGVPSNPNATGAGIIQHFIHSSSTLYALPEYDPGSQTHNEFSGWSFLCWAAHQIEPYSNPGAEVYTGWTVQITDLPAPISVTITSPANGTAVDVSDSGCAPLAQTAPVTFHAEAFDEDGSKIEGANLSWNIAGVASGTGDTITVPVNTAGGMYDPSTQATRFQVTVIAKGKNGVGSATIYLVAKVCVR